MIAGLVDYEKATKLCDEWCTSHEGDVVCVATSNAPGSVTFSGQKEAMINFSKHLNDLGIKTRNVETNNVAFHSPLMLDVAKQLREKLSIVMPEMRPMPKNFLSTSVPENDWAEVSVRQYNGDYHVNNFISTVLFANIATKHIPKNAIVVEIGPQALLSSQIIKSVGNNGKFLFFSF